jgi:hypothetical protein
VSCNKIIDFCAEVLLKATLLAGLVPLAIVLDMHYAGDTLTTTCQNQDGGPGHPGVWSCAEQRRIIPPGSDVPLDEIGHWFIPTLERI